MDETADAIGDDTVSLQVFSGNKIVVVDTGSPSQRSQICKALKDMGVRPDDVTDMVQSHTHGDHTGNAGMFQKAVAYMMSSKVEKDV